MARSDSSSGGLFGQSLVVDISHFDISTRTSFGIEWGMELLVNGNQIFHLF